MQDLEKNSLQKSAVDGRAFLCYDTARLKNACVAQLGSDPSAAGGG